MSKLSVPEQHQVKVARATMKMSCVGALCMGGPNHVEASKILRALRPDLGAEKYLDDDCTCEDRS